MIHGEFFVSFIFISLKLFLTELKNAKPICKIYLASFKFRSAQKE